MISNLRQETVAKIGQAKISAIIRSGSQTVAARAMEAAVAGGFRLVEFTMTTPGAMELIKTFSRMDGMIVGAGTVMSVESVRSVVSAGAQFVVSPICDPEVLAEAARLNVPTIPGCFTPTEMEMAHRAGADIIKVFPAPPGGVDFIRALRGPLAHLRLFPTAGPTLENFTEYLDAGCFGVGFVRALFDPGDLAAGRYSEIEERAVQITAKLSQWMQKQGATGG